MVYRQGWHCQGRVRAASLPLAGTKRPAILQEGMNQPLSWVSVISSMPVKSRIFIYRRVPQVVLQIWRSLAQTSINAESPSGGLPTTLVHGRISFMFRSIPLFVRILIQCSLGNFIYVRVFFDTLFNLCCSFPQFHASKFLYHIRSLLAGTFQILLRMNRLQQL
jgi:hypothetical protein